MRLLDGWSVPHFLFGVVMATAAQAFTWSWGYIFVVTLSIAILWEAFEIKVKLREAPGNALMDVFLPLVAYWLTLSILARVGIDPEHQVALFTITLLIYGFTNFIAWQARLRRDREFVG